MRLSLTKDLAPDRAAAVLAIDLAAEHARAAFITPGDGQAMVYQAKSAEASRYLALTEPPSDLAEFPLMAAEVGITASTAGDLALLWKAMADSWLVTAAAIERLRLGAKRSVAEASTPEEIAAARMVDWPTP